MNGNLIGFLSLGVLVVGQICVFAFWCGKVSEAIISLQKSDNIIKEDIKDVRKRLDTHLQGGKT